MRLPKAKVTQLLRLKDKQESFELRRKVTHYVINIAGLNPKLQAELCIYF